MIVDLAREICNLVVIYFYRLEALISMERIVNCDMCTFRYRSDKAVLFLNHVKTKHRLEKGNFYTTCKLSGCFKVYVKYTSFRAHWYREHNPKNRNATVRQVLAEENEGNNSSEISAWKSSIYYIFSMSA